MNDCCADYASLCTITIERPDTSCFEQGMSFDATSFNIIANVQADTAEKCQALCRKDSSCKYFNWIDVSHCQLLELNAIVGGRTGGVTAVSGPSECHPLAFTCTQNRTSAKCPTPLFYEKQSYSVGEYITPDLAIVFKMGRLPSKECTKDQPTAAPTPGPTTTGIIVRDNIFDSIPDDWLVACSRCFQLVRLGDGIYTVNSNGTFGLIVAFDATSPECPGSLRDDWVNPKVQSTLSVCGVKRPTLAWMECRKLMIVDYAKKL